MFLETIFFQYISMRNMFVCELRSFRADRGVGGGHLKPLSRRDFTREGRGGQSRSVVVSSGQSRSVAVSHGQSRSVTVRRGQSRSVTVSCGQLRSVAVSRGQSRSVAVSHG